MLEQELTITDIISSQQLQTKLEALGLRSGDTMLAHVSLSSLGYLIGGERALISAILGLIGKRGTLLMPSFSESLSSPMRWTSPRFSQDSWANIMESTLPFDRRLTPIDSSIGRVAQYLWHYPGTIRSNHPLFSFIANGPRARSILAKHRLTSTLGEGSPLARLYELDAKVLMIGCSWSSCSMLHLAEHRAVWPKKQYYTEHVQLMTKPKLFGKRQKELVAFRCLDHNSEDFKECGIDYENDCRYMPDHGQVYKSSFSKSPAYLLPAKNLVDFASDWFSKHR